MDKAYFSPGESCRESIIQNLNKASKSVKICVFTISDDWITKAIISCHKRGVKILLLTDNDKCYDTGSDIKELFAAGIEVKVDKTPYHMHHKFAILDNKIVLTGSYNWTRSAALYNHENIISSKDPQLVKDFSKEFEKLWEQMLDY